MASAIPLPKLSVYLSALYLFISMGLTPLNIILFNLSFVKSSPPNLETTKAAIPDICGHAIEVPCKYPYCDFPFSMGSVLKISDVGEKCSKGYKSFKG